MRVATKSGSEQMAAIIATVCVDGTLGVREESTCIESNSSNILTEFSSKIGSKSSDIIHAIFRSSFSLSFILPSDFSDLKTFGEIPKVPDLVEISNRSGYDEVSSETILLSSTDVDVFKTVEKHNKTTSSFGSEIRKPKNLDLSSLDSDSRNFGYRTAY
eukprot:76459_1